MDDTDVSRDDYTWDLVPRDLAIQTHLTLRQAIQLCTLRLEHSMAAVHPYDAVPLLADLARGLRLGPEDDATHYGHALAAVIDAATASARYALAALADDTDCHYDADLNCRAHAFHTEGGTEPCPQAQAHAVLAAYARAPKRL